MTTRVDTEPLGAALAAIDATVANLANDAIGIFTPVVHARNALRRHLLSTEQIITFDQHAPTQHAIAVDGGMVKESLYAADLLVAVAAGYSTTTQPAPVARVWTHLAQRRPDNDRLLAAAMAAHELALLAEAATTSSATVYMDGSTATPMVSIARALGSRSPEVSEQTAELITSLGLPAAVEQLVNTHSHRVIALPKADSQQRFSETYARQTGLNIPGGDRMLAMNVLEPGELLTPRPASELATTEFRVSDNAAEHVHHCAHEMDAALTELRRAAATGAHAVTYFKPTHSRSVIKLEFRASSHHRSDITSRAQELVGQLNADTAAAVLEPLAQYQADLKAKQVSEITTLLRSRLASALPSDLRTTLTPTLVRNYRTF